MAECVSKMCSAHQAGHTFMLFLLTIIFGYKMKIHHLISVDELSRFCYQRQRTLPPMITLRFVSWFEYNYHVITTLNIITILCKCPPPINTSYCRLSLTLRIAEGKCFFFRNHGFRHMDSQMGPCLFLFFYNYKFFNTVYQTHHKVTWSYHWTCRWVKQL